MRANKRSDPSRFQSLAEDLGFSYEAEPELSALARLPIVGRRAKVFDCLHGQHENKPAAIFYLTTGANDPDAQEEHYTVFLFEKVALPEFDCISRAHPSILYTMCSQLLFDPKGQSQQTCEAIASFNRRYVVVPLQTAYNRAPGSSEDQLRELFRAPLLAALAAWPNWRIQATGNCLALVRQGHKSPQDLRQLWQEASTIRAALVTPADHRDPVLPAPRGMEMGRQEARFRGRGGGALVGSVLGFFGGFIVFVSVHIGRRPAMTPDFKTFAFAIFGGLALGLVGGAILGGWLRGRLYHPQQRWRPKPHFAVAGCAVAAGGMLGWFLGAVLGMLLTVSLSHLFGEWALPILVFSPPVLCLILGGAIAYWICTTRRDP